MRNALVGKPAGMRHYAQPALTGVTLIALFAFVVLAFGIYAQKAYAAPATGSVKITVVDTSGSQPSNVTLTIKKKGAPSRSGGTSAIGSIITFVAEPGTYVISRSGSSKYKTWGGDCNSSGEVSIVVGAQANCTLSNASVTSPPPTGGSDGGSTPRPAGRSR